MINRHSFASDWSYDLTNNFLIWTLIIVGLFLVFLGFWVFLSFIRTTNSQNFTGEVITKKIFTKIQTYDMLIIKSLFFSKRFSYNPRKNTYRIRSWIFSGTSIWTLSSAAQQAYLASKRFVSNTRNLNTITWLPWVIRIFSLLLSALVIYFSYHFNGKSLTGSVALGSITTSVFIFMTGFIFSSIVKINLLRQSTLNLVSDFGLSKQETKELGMTFWAMMFVAFPIAILDILFLAIRPCLKK